MVRLRVTMAVVAALSVTSASADDEVGPETMRAEIESVVREYCTSIADEAAETRRALQEDALQKLQAEVDVRIVRLEERTAEAKAWIERQEAMLAAANSALVDIYAKMDPETAASQIAQVSRDTAVSIISQLNARAASAILNEMPPETAAALVKAMASPLKLARTEDQP